MLGAAVLGMVGIALIIAYNTRSVTPGVQGEDTVASATLQGYYLGQLLIGSLGVLFVTGEYGTGMIRSTLAAVPRRVPVLLAKVLVFTGVVTTTMVAASFVAFVSAQALLAQYRPGFSLGDPDVLRYVIGTGVYLTLVGLLGGAIGWLVRSTPGALVTFFALVLVVPGIVGGFFGTIGRHQHSGGCAPTPDGVVHTRTAPRARGAATAAACHVRPAHPSRRTTLRLRHSADPQQARPKVWTTTTNRTRGTTT